MNLKQNYQNPANQPKTVFYFLSIFSLIALSITLGCGNPDLESGLFSNEDNENADIDTLSSGLRDTTAADAETGEVVLNLTSNSNSFFCPEGFYYDSAIRLCTDGDEAIGPFPQKMRDECEAKGGGAACKEDNWNRAFAAWIRGKGVCPNGSVRASNGLCIEKDHAFGPFTKEHVEACEEYGGGDACYSLRWAKNFAVATLPESSVSSRFTFPFDGPATTDFLNAPRSFGSCRSNCRRKHAAADLYSHYRRPIYAVGDGTVKDFYYFYDGTYALVVDHGDFVVRYGEIMKRLPSGIYIGAKVKRGQHIASIGDLASLPQSMLHFERYTGKGSGQLTQRSNPPFQRRWDLVNPTQDLLDWEYPR